MKQLPYFCWYPADAEADAVYRSMTDEELGHFHRLLNLSWTNNGIPADAAERARIMQRSKVKADKLWKTVGKCFQLSPTDPSRLLNPRQEVERSTAIYKSKIAKEAGLKSAEIKRNRRTNGSTTFVDIPLTDRSKHPPTRASDSVSESVSDSSVKPSNEEKTSTRAQGENIASIQIQNPEIAVGTVNPLEIFELCSSFYEAGGVPISDAHREDCIRLIIGISIAKRPRIVKYVAWAFGIGKWSSPAMTKTFKNLLNDGDWDVEITRRTISTAAPTPKETDRQRAVRIAKENFRRAQP